MLRHSPHCRAQVHAANLPWAAQLPSVRRSLHQAVLVKDPVLDLTTPAQQVTVSEPYIPAELPADIQAFIARATEIDRLRTALDSADGPALTVIDGPGGIGKSALTVRVAHAMTARFTDGVIYLNLHGSTPDSTH
ncbi:hypothetical protein ACIBQ1_54230 [Nonomuraea sp. NPDC050153]|uniref:hypothetical protein n=1 Tax=Nonomuraea sp. NPDC050153 TaxID=3364359 RepID=UPI003798C45E